MNIYDTEFFKNWQNQGNTNEGITSQGIPDFQNYYNMNLGNQPFPHTGMQLPDVQPPGIEQSNVAQTQKKGFNFPGIFSLMQNMFQRPEAKQKEFETYQQSKGPGGWGDIGGGYQGNIWGNNKLNVYDPASEQMILRDKNFDSAFGSGSVEEMIAKKEAWARKRRAKGEEYLSEALKGWLDELDKGKGGTGTGVRPDKGGPTTTYTGPKTFAFDPGAFQRSGGQRPDKPGGFTDPGKGSYGPHKAQGGYMRSRYNRGGRVGILAAF